MTTAHRLSRWVYVGVVAVAVAACSAPGAPAATTPSPTDANSTSAAATTSPVESTTTAATTTAATTTAATTTAATTTAATTTMPATIDETDPTFASGSVSTTSWAAHLSGPTNQDEVDGVAAGPDGSLFVTGKFERTATLGGIELVSAGRADIPFARFAPDGQPIWVTSFGGPGEDNFFDVDADESGAVAAGIFHGTVRFGDVTLVSAGDVDCAVVAIDPDGEVRWARSFGGPGVDGCNEVTIAPDGSIVTSIDTDGGAGVPGGEQPVSAIGDTVLLHLGPDGELQWSQRVGGDGPQRGKAISVAPDGSVAFGGETFGDLDIDGEAVAVPGRGFDAWLSRWTADGELEWVVTWGGAGRDLAKGVLHDEEGIFAVGPFDGRIDLQGTELDADGTTDLLVARFDLDGTLAWATSVRGDGPLTGAEVTSAAAGGLLLGSIQPDGLEIRDASGESVVLNDGNGGAAWLATYRVDGSVGWASTIAGTVTAGPGEIARVGTRLYLDMTVRDDANSAGGSTIVADGKDSAVYALDVPG